jgi:hypothetical protein
MGAWGLPGKPDGNRAARIVCERGTRGLVSPGEWAGRSIQKLTISILKLRLLASTDRSRHNARHARTGVASTVTIRQYLSLPPAVLQPTVGTRQIMSLRPLRNTSFALCATIMLLATTGCTAQEQPAERPASSPSTPATEPSDFWWSYIVKYEKGPGSTLLNLRLKDRAPVAGYPYALITGLTYKPDPQNGLPGPDDLDTLNAIADRRRAVLQIHTPFITAGTFTHNGERLEYLYIRDTAGVRTALAAFYGAEAPTRTPYTNIRVDPTWRAYLDFLYPNRQILDYYHDDLARLGFSFPTASPE